LITGVTKVHFVPSQCNLLFQHLIRVPVFKEERFHSIPLSGGSAEPWEDTNEAPPIHVVRHVDGQFMSGEMVPKREKKRSKEVSRTKEMLEASRNGNDNVTSPISAHNRRAELTPLLEVNEAEYGSF